MASQKADQSHTVPVYVFIAFRVADSSLMGVRVAASFPHGYLLVVHVGLVFSDRRNQGSHSLNCLFVAPQDDGNIILLHFSKEPYLS